MFDGIVRNLRDSIYPDEQGGLKRRKSSLSSRKKNGFVFNPSTAAPQLEVLQLKTVEDSEKLEKKTDQLIKEWKKDKPVGTGHSLEKVIALITSYERKIKSLKGERENLQRNKEALELCDAGDENPTDYKVFEVLEDIESVKVNWMTLTRTNKHLEALRKTPWNEVNPKKLRVQLESLNNQLAEMPEAFKESPTAIESMKTIEQYQKYIVLIAELKSGSLKEHHWNTLIKALGIKWEPDNMVLEDIWTIDFEKNGQAIMDVLTIAQGENALSEFLKQIRETWSGYTLEMVNYQNKCRLIRGWDELFTSVREDINSVNAMKLSPYFKAAKKFEMEALEWEDNLNAINNVFDTWIDVQRRWVYLYGIFIGSSDIKSLLPAEYKNFENVSNEFLTLMKKVEKSPKVLQIIKFPRILKQVQGLLDALKKTQKSLGEYLERQRAGFARFYFLGDDDLLEIIGNSKNIPRLQKHFKKMFAGLNSLKLSTDNGIIQGIMSKEMEVVDYFAPINVRQYPRLNDWLNAMEKEMRMSLARNLANAVIKLKGIQSQGAAGSKAFIAWVDDFQAQLIVLASQVSWSESIVASMGNLDSVLQFVEGNLNILADSVLIEQPQVRRKKLEHLVIERVHQRDVTRMLIKKGLNSDQSFDWLCQMRFQFNPAVTDPLKQLNIQMANAQFFYGFEYLGLCDRLVQTPLTDRCFLTLTQALEARLGGSPFGPAGTGKTESVKALGNQLGRFVLVFNCDETFDFLAMGRIFVGLCQVGAWGCFDEFNRLEERMLSAVSQQIQNIQEALTDMANDPKKEVKVELLGNQIKLNPDIAVFITMNPGYAGRSNLPDNLKKLFRSIAMTQPDRKLIAQVMLYSQGFRMAEKLASKVVPFFKLCNEQLSSQSHYDFGLRALKSVLVSAGNVKRERIMQIKSTVKAGEKELDINQLAERLPEQEVVIQSLMDTLVPKLVSDDIPLLYSLLGDVFPGMTYKPLEQKKLKEHLKAVCEENFYCYSDEPDKEGSLFAEKMLQLYQITNIQHGLMMVGPSGSGKSTAWNVLLQALDRIEGEGNEGTAHIIDPKSVSKDDLYGFLDPNTREWTDGLFTHVLRNCLWMIDNVRGEVNKRQWIIFDGDVDPEWVENLNSVLDDNKLLTLPNGERLSIPPNVRIMFEVETLKYATLATVSRCGMIWFSEEVITDQMVLKNFLGELRSIPVKLEDLTEEREEEEVEEDEDGEKKEKEKGEEGETEIPNLEAEPMDAETSKTIMEVQKKVADLLEPYFNADGIVIKALNYGEKLEHIMDYTHIRSLNSLFAMCRQIVHSALNWQTTTRRNSGQKQEYMPPHILQKYVAKSLVIALLWSITGDGRLRERESFSEYLRDIVGGQIEMPSDSSTPVIDFEVTQNGEWDLWSKRVPFIEINADQGTSTEVVIPTMDTVRHERILYTWMSQHKPVLLCGPPGSGKTMTLFSVLRELPALEVVGLNFSSATSPELFIKSFDQYCNYHKTPMGVVLAPMQMDKWLVFFCDEINLPDEDNYGTQRVISFLRQMVERQGFYRTSDNQWIAFHNIQFVGACNPPTDPGRKPLSHRFLRHVPIVYVDYPGEMSLKQIYGTFNRSILKKAGLSDSAESLTNAMVEFFLMTKDRFTHDIQPHYIYSPREMTRWVRGVQEALKPKKTPTENDLVRIWAHEALRLFQDRLIHDDERRWCDENIDGLAATHFTKANTIKALKRPILFSNWITKIYEDVTQEKLRTFLLHKLKRFYEEELGVPLVLFDQVIDHALRIDRVFRQPQGHLLMIGISGSGKTTLSRFVSYINGLSVFQVKVHNNYSAEDFDEDLRGVLTRAGCQNEKIAFIMDETNVKDSSFLERINTLLANAEVPGLFEGEEYSKLMTACKDAASKDGSHFTTGDELYRWFTHKISLNLHVIFTMNPSTNGLKDRASTSPALFNRCVLNWFGDWSTEAYYQVAHEFTASDEYSHKEHKDRAGNYDMQFNYLPSKVTLHDIIANAFVCVHKSLHGTNDYISKRGGRIAAITPRHFLDAIAQFTSLKKEKLEMIEQEKKHLIVGLEKIKETASNVANMQTGLAKKKEDLEKMNKIANSKMEDIKKQKDIADTRKKESQEMQVVIISKEKKIKQKKESVMKELSVVLPAVEEAKQAVSCIKKTDMAEIKSLKNPPALVKVTVESVCTLMGETNLEWKNCQAFIGKDGFLSNLLSYNSENITPAIQKTMHDKYLSNKDYNFENINRASAACGPMCKYVVAQIKYSEIALQILPMQKEMEDLERDAQKNQVKANEVNDAIKKIEVQVKQLEKEYNDLMKKVNEIKQGLENVLSNVGRAKTLLTSLDGEKVRWQGGSGKFQKDIDNINGNSIITGCYLAYAGYYDPTIRKAIMNKWCSYVEMSGIPFLGQKTENGEKEDYNFNITFYLSTPNERMDWKKNALPSDNLCQENAIILSRFKRYPLVIDPCGQGTEFIINQYKEKKMIRSSFIDSTFRRTLESAMRFGTPLLVTDVESYDSILNPVLNREVRKIGGRTTITVGNNEVDLSPSFMIILSTRDPTVEFPQDIASRVTFVNFTVTRSILTDQCLNTLLKAERPDVDTKRNDLLKLQGEFQLKLFNLEKNLLDTLSSAKGNILENTTVITQLETLKKEATEIEKKSKDTDKILAEVELVIQEYMPMAICCTNIYFTLDTIYMIKSIYQYSLTFFFDVLDVILHSKALNDIKDHKKRKTIITLNLCKMTFQRVARGMLFSDRMPLAIQFVEIYFRCSQNKGEEFKPEFDQLMKGKAKFGESSTFSSPYKLNKDQIANLSQLSKLGSFCQLQSKFAEANDTIKKWLFSEHPEAKIPVLWDEVPGMPKYSAEVLGMLAIQAVRPDRLVAAMEKLVNAVFGKDFLTLSESATSITSILKYEIKSPNTPMLLFAVQGYDPSTRVEELAKELKMPLANIAIGSAEGFTQADVEIKNASQKGGWVMLKNAHLAPSWLSNLEKKLNSLSANSKFQLFITMEVSNKLPANLLRDGRMILYEPPPGLKDSIRRILDVMPDARYCAEPKVRGRLYTLLLWLHSVVQERMRYVPLGWSKKYEFMESEVRFACDTIDTWLKIKNTAQTGEVPFDALTRLLAMCIYGGKIDNDFDQQLFESIMNSILQKDCVNSSFMLVDGSADKSSSITISDLPTKKDLTKWVEDLPHNQTPSWLGLPNNAENLLLTIRGTSHITALSKLVSAMEEEDEVCLDFGLDGSGHRESIDGRPEWMTMLKDNITDWLNSMNTALQPLQRTVENIKDPMYRCFEREVNIGIRLLAIVQDDLGKVQSVLSGESKATNPIRIMMNNLAKGLIPRDWLMYKIPSTLTLSQWIQDFILRLHQLDNASGIACAGGPPALRTLPVWMGGLFMPEAYITATRQAVAQANKWALEELILEVSFKEPSGFQVTGLMMTGGRHLKGRAITVCNEIETSLPTVSFKWIKGGDKSKAMNQVKLPLYTSPDRSVLLYTLTFESEIPENSFYQRGVAVLTTNLGQ